MELPLGTLFEKYGFYAILLYLIIERGFPILSKAMDKLIPAQIRKRRVLEQETLDLENRKQEDIERTADLREREVLAMESIAKHLIVIESKLEKIDDRFDLLERSLTQVSLSLATANQTLAVLLDRSSRRREDFDTSDTKPVKTIRRKK